MTDLFLLKKMKMRMLLLLVIVMIIAINAGTCTVDTTMDGGYSTPSPMFPKGGQHQPSSISTSPPYSSPYPSPSPSPTLASFFSKRKDDKDNLNHSNTYSKNAKDKDKNKSFLKIEDPQRIISMICKYGGIISLPEPIQKDLKIFSKTCHCDETYLDLLNCKLVVLNFTVSSSMSSSMSLHRTSDEQKRHQSQPAIRVGRICFKWDSYRKPCLDIEVDEIDVLIEFVNIFLTRNNWNELQDEGFPPKFYYESIESGEKTSHSNKDKTPSSASSSLSPYITIGSIDFNGKMVVKVRSRVLDKQLIDDVELDLDHYLDAINDRIRDAAEESFKMKGRRGCTTDEVYSIIRKYFNELLNKSLKSTATNLAFGAFGSSRNHKNDNEEESVLARQSKIKAKMAMSQAKEMLSNYAKNVGDKTTEELEKNFAEMGMNLEQIGIVKGLLKSNVGELFQRK